MEIGVKLRLPDSNSHQKLSTILSPLHIKSLIQENIFFDSKSSKLSSNLAALRLSKPIMSNGISCVKKHEEPIDPRINRVCVAEPWKLLGVRREVGIGENEDLVCLSGFRNVRQVFDWKGLKLELEPEKYKELIEGLLKDNWIEFSYSEANEFALFRSGKLP
ncbi:hypothetical protein BDE02_01G024900 [Populus trichocarpa]|nr:hypothetical protein BDE02_01G024900 [Populus trichocarpa]